MAKFKGSAETQSLSRNLRALNTECDQLDQRLIEFEQALMNLESKSSTSEINALKAQMKDIANQQASMQRTLNTVSDKIQKGVTTQTVTNADTSKKVINTANTTYTVGKGDTLSKIAKKYGVSVKQIKSINQMDSDFIQVGQSLTIPKSVG